MAGAAPLWRRWTLAATLGELIGFAVPAVVGALVLDLHQAVVVVALAAAGFVEGSALGYAQSAVVRDLVPAIRRRSWTLATGAAATLAWLLGILPSTLGGRVPDTLLWTVVVLSAPVLLCSIGGAQWLLLRRHRTGVAWWVPATAGAWLVGLGVFLGISSPLWRPGQPVATVALIGVLAGAAMAFTTAALTGLAAVRLAHRYGDRVPPRRHLQPAAR